MLISTSDAPEVLTGPMPASLELMPRADGAERFLPLIAKIDAAEAEAMSIRIADTDSDEIIRAKAAQARRMRLDIFRPSRVEADKLHADLKSGVLEIGRRLDKARADFRTRCERIEDHLASVENELKRREAEAAAARLTERQQAIAPFAIPRLPLPQWPDDADQFAAILEAQKTAHAGWVAEQERKKAEAAAEAERKRKEAEEAEAKRLAELEEARAAKAKADEERKAAEAKLAAEREEQRKALAEERRIQAEALAAQQQKAKEERERLEAELEKERQAAAEERRKAAEAAEKARIEQAAREAAQRNALGRLPHAAAMMAAALRDIMPDLSGDYAAAATAALAYYDEIAAEL